LEFAKKISALIDLKTIVTIALVGAVIYLAIVGKIDANKVYELAIIVVTYYFVKKKVDESK